MSNGITILPISAHATKLIVERYNYGEMIGMDDLDEMLEVQIPNECTFEDGEKIKMVKLGRMAELTNRLLEEHSIMLKNIRAEGYVLVMPKEQTAVVLDEMDNKLKKHVNTATKRLKHIRFDLISEKKQQENVSARQRAAGIKSMLRRERKLFAVGLNKIESDD